VNFKIGETSVFELILAYFWAFMIFALFAGTIIVAMATIIGNVRDKWPYYDKKRKFKVIQNFVVFFGLLALFMWLGASIET
jgi:hypothetical protein